MYMSGMTESKKLIKVEPGMHNECMVPCRNLTKVPDLWLGHLFYLYLFLNFISLLDYIHDTCNHLKKMKIKN